MRKLIGNKRALSPVLSTVFLILIVAVGMSVAFAFFVNYVKEYQAGRGSSVMELIEIEDVWFKDAEGRPIEVWLYNYGKVEVKIVSVYVDGQQVDFTLEAAGIAVGKHGSLTVYLGGGWEEGKAYHLKVVTERGSAFEGTYVSPVLG